VLQRRKDLLSFSYGPTFTFLVMLRIEILVSYACHFSVILFSVPLFFFLSFTCPIAYPHQDRTQVLRLGEEKYIFRGKMFVFIICFKTNFSGHNT